MTRSIRLRSAFMLIEVLVTISIIALLFGMLIPAVIRVRETASRTKCSHQLMQIGLALNNYHDVNQHFPAGYTSDVAADNSDTGPGWGWAADILPYMQKDTLYSALRFDQPIEAVVNDGLRDAPIPIYLCPSDGALPVWEPTQVGPSGVIGPAICFVASANYIGVFGNGQPGLNGEGVFFRNSAVEIKNVTDGTASTFLAGERRIKMGPATWTGSVTGANLYEPLNGPEVKDGSGMVLGRACHPPGTPGEVNEFSSYHSGGANFVFVDGHVTFITASIDPALYQALATRAGREPIPRGF